MNKKKIIIFIVLFLAVIFLIFDFLTYRINKIVKDLLINQSKEFLCQQVLICNIDTTILGSSVKINKDRKSTRLNSSHVKRSRMPSSA